MPFSRSIPVQKVLKIAFALLPLLYAGSLFAQGGPAGVGDASNNAFWLDAEDQSSYSDGDPVSSWNDRSGNGNDFTHGNSSYQPEYNASALNGKATLIFDGHDYLQAGNMGMLETDDVTWFVVGKPDPNAGTQWYMRSRFTNEGDLWGTYFKNGDDRTHSRGGSFKALQLGSNSGSFNVMTTVWDGAADELHGFRNGGSQGTRTGVDRNPSSHDRTRIGTNSGSAGSYLDGEVGEVIGYSKTLNTAERIIVDNYLASKYGLSMASNDKYAHDGSFGDHVAGIGQDASGGNNTDAKGSSVVQMTITGSSSLSNDDYQLWGDDGADTVWISGDDPFSGSSSARLQRIFRVDETSGGAGQVDIVFHLGSNTYGDNSQYQLLTSTDTDFSNANTTGPGNFSSGSNTVTFTDVDLSDDIHFTIGNPGQIIRSSSNGNWNNSGTWDCGCVPTAQDEVEVNDDVTIGAKAESGKLNVTSIGSLTFSGSDSLIVHGDLRLSGGFTAGTGTIGMRADSAQTIDLAGTSKTLNNLHIDNSTSTDVNFANASSQTVTIQNTGTVSFADGDLDVSGVGTFLLESILVSSPSDERSARIGSIPSGSDLAGNVTVQRKIGHGNGNAGYIDMSSPVTGASIESMDDDNITLSGKTTGGFDDGCAYGGSGCFYSVKEYSGGSLNDVTQTSTSMSAMKGFELYVGDNTNTMSTDRLVDITGGVQNPGTLSSQNFSTFNGSELILTGNPYASQVDWHEIQNKSNDINDYYYVTCATGNYETYDASTGNASSSELNGNGTISAFQGFWAEGNAGTPQVEFRQSSKVSTSSGFAKSEPTLYSEGMFGLKMGSKMNSFSCRSKVAFNGNATRAEDEGLDIPHMPAPVEKAPELVFLSQDKKELRRQAVHSFDEEVSLPVLAKTPVKGTYTIEAENVNAIGQYECVKLIDLKTRKTYNLREQSKIRFDITEKENEDPRFNLVLSNDGDCRSATSIEDEASSGPIVNITQDQKGANVRVNLSKRQEVKLKVFDMMGRPVRETESFNAKTANKRISAPETSGIYMIVVETENDRVTKRVKF